ncbi:hypothetical protein [Streptomyces ipomoeae]|nr:hypothetical protein [Streptomyces ipomoeae]MDX2934916.1 hypothetical protein [Streptomyces ipomoeae]
MAERAVWQNSTAREPFSSAGAGAGAHTVHHQQTKNLLVSCSPKKPGFF